ncbi:MAG: alpha/beta fold hydrolase [bacterium]|nr:alpha/beta fold hydrolase [bacterium]
MLEQLGLVNTEDSLYSAAQLREFSVSTIQRQVSSMRHNEIKTELQGRAGRMEALLATANPDDCRGGALLLHPHPLYGGNMHSKVLYTARRICAEQGLFTLRFNFRGTGGSEGHYDDGQGEQDDVGTGLDHLRDKLPGKPLYLVGFSFGAWLALKIGAAHPDVVGMVGLGTPVDWTRFAFLTTCTKPKLLIHGGRDQYCDPESLTRNFPDFAEPKRLHWLAEADHFFLDHLPELETLLRRELPFILV